MKKLILILFFVVPAYGQIDSVYGVPAGFGTERIQIDGAEFLVLSIVIDQDTSIAVCSSVLFCITIDRLGIISRVKSLLDAEDWVTCYGFWNKNDVFIFERLSFDSGIKFELLKY